MTRTFSRPRPGNRLIALLIALALCVPLMWQAKEAFAVPANDVDLAVTISDQPGIVVAGRNLAYMVHTHNYGPDTAHVVKVTLDTGSPVLRYAANTNQANVTCVQTNGTVITCTLTNNLASGASVDFTVLTNTFPNAFITLHNLNPNAVQFTTTAVISSDLAQDEEQDSDDNTDSVTTRVKELANLRIRKIVDPSVPAGQDFTYTIRVDNLGPSYARGVMFDDNTIGTGNFQVKNVVPDLARSDSCVTTPGFLTQTMDSQITCTLGDALEPIGDFSNPAPATNTGRWKVRATMNSAVANQLDNVGQVFTKLTVTADCAPGAIPCPGTPDPNTGNNSATARVNVGGPGADLQMFAVFGAEVQVNGLPGLVINTNSLPPMPDPACCNFGGTTFTAGRRINWQSTVFNAGPEDADNVVMKVLLPEHSQLIENTLTTQVSPPPPFAQGRCYTQAAGANRTMVICEFGKLVVPTNHPDVNDPLHSAPQSGSVTFQLLMDPDIDPGNQMSIDAIASSEEHDPNEANNVADIQFDSNAWADLKIDKVPLGASPWPAGSVQTIRYEVTNLGPSEARSVQVIDNLGPNLEFVSDFGGLCNVDATNQLLCTLGDILPADGKISVLVDVRVKGATPSGTILNSSAVVSALTPDPFLANNTDVPPAVTTSASADLALTMSVASAGWTSSPLQYTIKVTNNGPSTATGVVLTFDIPQVKGAQFGAATAGCVPGVGVVTCSLGSLAPGQSKTVQIQILTQKSGDYVADASVSANEFDSDFSNNSAVAFVHLTNPPVPFP